jgi:hypothetical protein
VTNRKEIVERRKHKRFQVQDGAFAVAMPPQPRSTPPGQIIDVSRGGLAFRYIAGEEGSNGSFELIILLANNNFHLDKVPFETISDFEIANEVPFSSITMRRRGVQFGKLTDKQISQLDYFIRNYTIGDV